MDVTVIVLQPHLFNLPGCYLPQWLRQDRILTTALIVKLGVCIGVCVPYCIYCSNLVLAAQHEPKQTSRVSWCGCNNIAHYRKQFTEAVCGRSNQIQMRIYTFSYRI